MLALLLVAACAGSGAAPTTEALPVQHPSTAASAVAAPATTTTPETSTTSTPRAHGDILVAASGSPTSATSSRTTVLFDASRAFSTPSGAIVFQRADDSTIRADVPDGSAHVAISPAPKTHLRLYDAGIALGVESILYSTIDETDLAREVLHISNLDGTNSRTLGDIGFWEGWTNAAHLGDDRVVSEERTAGSFYPTSFDLNTGDRTDLPSSTAGATALSVSDDSSIEAHMENDNLVVSRLKNGVGSITIPLPAELVDRLYSIEISSTQAIINTSDMRPALITFPANLTGATTNAALGVTGYASFIEHPMRTDPASTIDTIEPSNGELGTPVLCTDPWLQPFCTDTVEITDTSPLAFAPVTVPTLGAPVRVATNGSNDLVGFVYQNTGYGSFVIEELPITEPADYSTYQPGLATNGQTFYSTVPTTAGTALIEQTERSTTLYLQAAGIQFQVVSFENLLTVYDARNLARLIGDTITASN